MTASLSLAQRVQGLELLLNQRSQDRARLDMLEERVRQLERIISCGQIRPHQDSADRSFLCEQIQSEVELQLTLWISRKTQSNLSDTENTINFRLEQLEKGCKELDAFFHHLHHDIEVLKATPSRK